ncbi:MAG: hypothetical protein ACRDEA_17610 [Microcystaceae cyanobacterium]
MVLTPIGSTNYEQQFLQRQTKHFWKKKYPKRYEHYILEDFFCFQQEKGEIIDWNDARNILVSEDFIIGLIEGLEQEVGNASSVVMYNIGREWGKKDADFFKHWFETEYEYENTTWKVNPAFLTKSAIAVAESLIKSGVNPTRNEATKTTHC